MSSVDDIELLKEIKRVCYHKDIRATWVGCNYPETSNAEYKSLAKWALEHLKMYEGFFTTLDKTKPCKILDVACGTGYNTNIISTIFTLSEVVGVDIEEECISFANRYNKSRNVEYVRDSILTYKGSCFYDYIFCLETLEHIPATEHISAIKNLLDNLSVSGRLFISTPKEDTADTKQSYGHIGIVNSERFEEISRNFSKNIITVRYYNGKKLVCKYPEYITDDLNIATHYMITLGK